MLKNMVLKYVVTRCHILDFTPANNYIPRYCITANVHSVEVVLTIFCTCTNNIKQKFKFSFGNATEGDH
jgi:hypothetical protein